MVPSGHSNSCACGGGGGSTCGGGGGGSVVQSLAIRHPAAETQVVPSGHSNGGGGGGGGSSGGGGAFEPDCSGSCSGSSAGSASPQAPQVAGQISAPVPLTTGSSERSQPNVATRLSQLLFRSTQGCVSDVSPMQAPSPGWQSVASGQAAPPPTWAAVSVQARSFAASHSAVHSDQDPSRSASLWATNIDLRCETRHDGIFGRTVLAGTGAVWPQARSQPTCTAGRFLRTPSRQIRSQRCRTRLSRIR